MTAELKRNADLRDVFDIINAMDSDDSRAGLEHLNLAVCEWGADKAEIMDSTPAQRACRSLLVSQVKTYIQVLSQAPDCEQWQEIFGKLRQTVQAALHPASQATLDPDVLLALEENLGKRSETITGGDLDYRT